MGDLRGRSLRDFYHDVCSELKVTPNSMFTNLLPTNSGELVLDEELNFSANYIGDRGMSAVSKVISVGYPRLKSLKLKNNGLRNKSIVELSEIFQKHGSIKEIDLSNNFISTGAGKALEKLLHANQNIKVLNIDGTKIDADIRIKIQDILRKRN